MNNKIFVGNNALQPAMDNFVANVKECMNIDLASEKVQESSMDEYLNVANDFFDCYEHNNYKLMILAAELYVVDYDFLELVLEYEKPNPLLVNELLKQYILDQISEHQLTIKELKK